MYNIFTDGACKGNPGPGGWGVYIDTANETIEIYGGEDNTTNNRMELQATIEALEFIIEEKYSKVNLYTDSMYVMKGIQEWIITWRQKDFKGIKNKDQWQKLDSLNEKVNIRWNWIKAHTNKTDYITLGNKKADELANLGVNEI